MNKIETASIPHEQLIHTLKEDYVKRIDEVDAFSKRLSNMCVECNTEFLYGCLDIAQHYLDAQKKHPAQFPGWYYPDLIKDVIKQNTEAWIQTVQNIDTVCIESMKNMKNNLRTLNKNVVLFLNNSERVYDIYENEKQNYKNESGTNENLKRSASKQKNIPKLVLGRTISD